MKLDRLLIIKTNNLVTKRINHLLTKAFNIKLKSNSSEDKIKISSKR